MDNYCQTRSLIAPLYSPPLFTESSQASFLDTPTRRSTISTRNQSFKENIMAQNTLSVTMGDGNIHSGNITSNFNSYVYKSDKDAEVMRWLSPLEPNNRHQGVRADRFDGVGDWILETKEFREWRSREGGADEAVLFCSGNPGVGKTYLR